jgi:hypothetical protein
LTGIDVRHFDVESADGKAVQNAVGIFVAEHQFSHLPAFQRYGWIPKFRLILEMKGLVFGDDCDANLRLRHVGVAAADKTEHSPKEQHKLANNDLHMFKCRYSQVATKSAVTHITIMPSRNPAALPNRKKLPSSVFIICITIEQTT